MAREGVEDDWAEEEGSEEEEGFFRGVVVGEAMDSGYYDSRMFKVRSC